MYSKLVPEIQTDPDGRGYVNMTAGEILDDLFVCRIPQTYHKYGSFRAMASYLTEAEYNVIKKILGAMATQSVLIADMVKMLELPGDESGDGGGLNHGDPAFRARVEALPDIAKVAGIITDEEYVVALSARTKVLGYATRLISKAESLGITDISLGNIVCAQDQIRGVN